MRGTGMTSAAAANPAATAGACTVNTFCEFGEGAALARVEGTSGGLAASFTLKATGSLRSVLLKRLPGIPISGSANFMLRIKP